MRVLDELNRLTIPDSDILDIQLLQSEVSKQSIEKLEKTLVIVEELKYQATRELRRLAVIDEDLGKLVQEEAISGVLEIAPDLLWRQAEIALAAGKEFDMKDYRAGLRKAIDSLDSYKVNIYGERLSVKFRIDLNRTAGTLDQYAKAILATRDKLNIGVMPTEAYAKGGVTASTFWYEKLYLPAREGGKAYVYRGKKGKRKKVDKTGEFKAKYWLTINTRLDNFNAFAPWWQLLDKGAIGLKSDRGGIPLPPLIATNFIQKAENEINNKFKNIFNTIDDVARTRINEIILKYKTYIKNCENLIKIIKRLIALRYGRRSISKLRPLPQKEIEEKFGPDQVLFTQQMALAKNLVLQQLGEEKAMRADKQKLQMLIEQLAYGEEITRTRLGKGIQLRTKEIEQKLQYNR